MANISMRCILVIVFLAAVGCQSDNPGASPWEKLQISTDTFSSMEYGSFLIEIYEHAGNNQKTTTMTSSISSEKRYFYYSPIALLDYKSATSFYNNVTKQPEMRFSIEMWNEKIQNEVVKHLNEIVGHQIKSNKVAVIPLEKVILASKKPTVDYSLDPEWTIYDKSTALRLSLSCSDQKICDQLANEMRSNPEQFDHFKLLYSLSSQRSQTKQTTISIDSVTSGRMFSTLLQKFRNKNKVFLTASDEKKMLEETATNIRMDTFDDYEVLSPDTEFQIYNILKDLLVTSRTTIKEECDNKWDSVFWHEDNYRPDKTTKTLNEIVNKLEAETQKKLADMFQKAEKQSEIIEMLTSNDEDAETISQDEDDIRPVSQSENADENEMSSSQTNDQEKSNCMKTNSSKDKIQHHNYDSNSWADVDRISSIISGKMSNDSDSSGQVNILKDDVEKLLQESRNHVQWDGEKFVPKPIQLSRINLDKFRDSQSFQDRNVRVRYTIAELSAPIKLMESAKVTVTDEWNNLKDELKATTELLGKTVTNLVNTNTELSNVKSDLTHKLEGTKQELEKSKIELDKTMADVRNYTTKLKATETELAEIKITTANLSTELKMCAANSQRLGQELKVTEGNLRANSNDLETTKTTLASTRTELNSTKSTVADLATKLIARTSELVDIGKMHANTRIDLNNATYMLEETKQELVKTRADFSKTFNNLSAKLEATEKELAETKITNGILSTELKMNSNRLDQELKVAEENLKKDLRATSNDLETTKTTLASTRTELNRTKSTVADLATELNARTSELVDINQMHANTRFDLTNITSILQGLHAEIKQELVKTRADFSKNVDGLSAKLKATEKELAETKITAGNISTELKTNSNRLGQELKVAEEKLQRNLRATSNDLETTKTSLASTKTDLSSTKSVVANLATKLNATEKELAETKFTTGILSAKLEMNSNRLEKELKVAEENLKKDLRATSNDLETIKTTLASTRTELNRTKSTVADLATELNARTSERVNIGRMPTSCSDLQRMGHELRGFFLVKGSKKMEIIYCDFFANQNDKQKWIGYADVKSTPVHFYVTRNSDFSTKDTPIPFNLARVNEGNAMNWASGIFTAPRPGIYFFSFTGVARFPASTTPYVRLEVVLYLNGVNIAKGLVEETHTVDNQWSPLTLQSTLNLKRGDRVWVQIVHMSTGVRLYDTGEHLTHFTGFMLEEEIGASL